MKYEKIEDWSEVEWSEVKSSEVKKWRQGKSGVKSRSGGKARQEGKNEVKSRRQEWIEELKKWRSQELKKWRSQEWMKSSQEAKNEELKKPRMNEE